MWPEVLELKEYRTSENMGSFLAKSTTRVMAGVMILVNSLKASRSTLSPSEEGTIGPCPMSSDWKGESALTIETLSKFQKWLHVLPKREPGQQAPD